MERPFLSKVYDFVNHLVHLGNNEFKQNHVNITNRICPITGLNITMQSKNSKFLSYTGVKWYCENSPIIFNKILLPRLTKLNGIADLDSQCREIAHSIRNADSNPRNNTKRAIKKLLKEHDCLFNNLLLIDKKKLEEAGLN